MTELHNWPVFGHDWAVAQLRKSIAHERVRHAYLFTGVESIGRNTLAHAFAMALNCTAPDVAGRPCLACRSCRLMLSGNHPDIIYAEHDANTGALRIEAIRTVMRNLAMKPFEARYRIAIFPDFDQAQPRAQDALLKTLEEPPPAAVLLLISRSASVLLPTITSRSQQVGLRPVALETIRAVLETHYGAEPQQAELLARLSGGRIGWALRAQAEPELLAERETALDMLEQCLSQNRAGRFSMAQTLSKDRQALGGVLALWLSYWRDLLLLTAGTRDVAPANSDRLVQLQQASIRLSVEEVEQALLATRQLLNDLRYNLNLRLAVEVMLLDYPGLRHE